MNAAKRIAELREEQRRLAQLQDDEQTELLYEVDLAHAEFLAGRIKERARRLTALAAEIERGLDNAEIQARRETLTSGRTA